MESWSVSGKLDCRSNLEMEWKAKVGVKSWIQRRNLESKWKAGVVAESLGRH